MESELRVFGEDLDPDHISSLMDRQPSSAKKKGDPYLTTRPCALLPSGRPS